VPIFQHSLPSVQSESFQTHVGTIHRWAIGPLALHNGTSAYTSLTCHLPAPTIECLHRPLHKLTRSSHNFRYELSLPTSKESAAKYTRPHPTDLQTRLTSSFQVPFISPRHIHSNAHFNCCVTMETKQTHCYATGTVVLLRKRNKPIVTQQSAEVMLPRKPNM
jgi:hypothetical protein